VSFTVETPYVRFPASKAFDTYGNIIQLHNVRVVQQSHNSDFTFDAGDMFRLPYSWLSNNFQCNLGESVYIYISEGVICLFHMASQPTSWRFRSSLPSGYAPSPSRVSLCHNCPLQEFSQCSIDPETESRLPLTLRFPLRVSTWLGLIPTHCLTV
jgi:hypothetical protein